MRVRAAEPEDARSIAVVHVASWQGAYRGLLPDAYLAGLSVDRRQATWSELLRDAAQWIVVAEETDGTVIGFACLCASRDEDAAPDTGELGAIYLHPDHWGHGYGTALLGAVLEGSRSRGFKHLTLWVLESNERARRFYEGSGFVVDGSEKVETRPGGVILRECRYGRDLKPSKL
jgi:GNAT superfamily N-acetyltransferase